MSLIKKELTEKSGYVIEFSISKEVYTKAETEAYNKNKKDIQVPGFRKGKAPMHVIKTIYGKDVFFEDAINACIPDAFEAAIKEAELDIVGNPKFDLVSMDGDVVLKAEGFVKPVIEIENYKGIKAKKKSVRVTKAEIDAEVDKVRERNARLVEDYADEVKNGDIISLDFDGYVNGVAFDGGKGENFELKIGSGSFIPGFEEKIIGHKIGEDFEVDVTFPEDYHAADMAGKEAIFKCAIKGVKVLPEADDEFAKDVSEFDTLDEYKADVKSKIADREKAKNETEFENALADELINNLKGEIPTVMFDVECENYLRDYDTRLRANGLDMNTYLKYTGLTVDALREQFRPQAEKQVKVRLALEKIAALENLEVSAEEIENEFNKMAENYKMKVEEVKKYVSEDDLKADLLTGKAMNLVKDTAVSK